MLVEGNAVTGGPEKIGQPILASLERLLAEIEAVELDQVEGAEHRGMVVMPIAKEIEHREPLAIDDDRLAVDDAGPRRQRRRRGAIFGKRAVKS